MVRIRATRKSRFAAALKLVGMTQKQWAQVQGNVSVTQLNEFLNGHRVSAPLTSKVDAFVAKVEAAEIVPVDSVA